MKNISIEKKKARFVLIVVILTMLLFCLFVALKVFAAVDWNRTYNFKINDDKGGEFTISWGHCHDAYIKGSTLTTAQMKTEVIDHFKTGGDCPDCSGTEFTSMTISGKTASVSGNFRRHTPFLKVVITKYPTGYRFAGFKEPAGGVSEEMFYAQDGDTFYIDCGAYTGAWYNRTAETNQGSYLRANNSTSDLTANWVANTYTIEYNGNGNTGGSTSSSSHTYDVSKELTSNGFTKTGYVFDGWNTKQDGSGTNYSDRQSVKNLTSTHGGKVILYAKWKKVTYRITYVLDSYSLKMIDSKGNDLKKDANGNYYIEGDYNTTTELVQVVPKNNYVFSHNYNDISGTFYDNPATWTFVSDRTIYMYCKPATYRITYILDNNSSKVVDSSGKELSKDSNGNYYVEGDYNSKTDNLTVVPKTGYHFSYTENSLSGKLYNNPEWWNITGNRTIYVYCDPNQYTVAYNANGGTGTMSNSIATYNSNFITRQNAFSLLGYTFVGWNEQSDNKGVTWNEKTTGTYENGTPWKWNYTKNITLYAQWSPNVYTITLDNQSATSAGTTAYYEKYNTGNYKESSCSNNITSITIPQKTGYKFLGYYTGTNGTGTQYVDASGKILSTATTFTSNVTLYAKWEKTIATIYYNANGGVVTTDKGYIIDNDGFLMLKDSNGNYVKAWKKVLYDDIDPVNVHNIHGTFGVSKVGYHSKVGAEYLVGSPTSSITIDNESTPLSFFQSYITNQDADILLYANWEANTYTINYYNGSTFLGYDNYTYDQAQDLKDFGVLGGKVTNNQYGWAFAGWSTSPNSTTITYTNKQNIKNITSTNNDVINLYAVYKRDITFKNGINGVTTNTVTQYWNPYGTTNGTHISSVKSPALTTIANWTALGYRNDTIATLSKQAANSNIYPPINESNIYYGVYSRIITFKSGVNASVTDKTETQYLNSYNNVVSSITSGTPSNIANWTILGYRDDSTIGDKEYAINTVISPSYNTDNTFYATYNRTLVITYDGNNNPHLSITGSVSDTTKVVYLNAYSTNTSSQEVTLRQNGFTYVGFDFVKWDIGEANKTYNPKLSYNHSTFKITAKAQWKHNDTGIGTIITPTLKVNNPNMSGIYYNDGIYFVKGDGKTAIELYGEATLNPSVLSRLDRISLNYVDNVLVQNPTYKEKYSLSIPKEDIWNFVYNKSNVIKYNEYTKDFVTLGEPIIVDFEQDKLSFTQKFTMIGKILVEPYVSSKASCVVKHEDGTDTIHDLYAYGNSLRLHSDPYKPSTYILNESGAKVEINSYNNKWTNESNITIVLEDEDSGIKYYKLIQNNIVIKEATNNAYTTQNTISLNLLESSTSYTLYIVDNVGNETTYTFTTNVDRVAPSVEDLIVTQGRNNVYTGNNNADAWPITSKSTTWEYNWEVLKALKYKVIDDKAGLKLVKITHYGQDSTYTNIWKSVTLVDINENKLNLGKETIIEEFNGDSFYKDGKNYLIIEVEDVVGNKTSVKLVVRRDKTPGKITNFKVTPVSLERYTIDELNDLFSKGDMSKFKTNVKFNISDYISTDDTSGVKKVEIVVKDSKGAIIKRYDVTNNVSISDYTLETNNGNGKFSPLVRPISGSINVNIDTLGEFPKYSDLKVCVEVTDYVDNKTTSNDVLITNYAIKSVIYATKDNAYNISSTNNATNTPYFKTGEVGFVEVWSVGYVDKLELDFSNGNIGQEMNDMISQGLISPKYILGVHGGLPSQVRFLSDLSAYKVSTSYPDVDGVSFATHISYSFSDVNNSMGTSGVDGWDTKGTMIRIPTNHELVALNKLDRYGNQLYKWETHLANVYPYKNDIQGTPSSSYYTIWDNAVDDLHFRIIHQIFKR